MREWLYFLGGCLTGFLVKKQVDDLNKPIPMYDWQAGRKYDGEFDVGDYNRTSDDQLLSETDNINK